ncbi:MAG: 16S rRNA (uracil(1498)-N(3))-methyltransferase [Gammaproteobacteria bacterium GWE2_37_16]|nr:MAG: 16S rRNA (uracil(1498)-N(3))-methyltransferase [Gammaproteobacteria bacterium GWE2_37_16]
MHIPRIYIETDLKTGAEINLTKDASQHLHVLRLKCGDSLLLFNGNGEEYTAILQQKNKNCARIQLIKCFKPKVESSLKINIVQGLARGEKMDFIIQKATELGAQTITPLITEYCNVNLSDERLEKRLLHWQAVAISAVEQSGRCCIPKIQPAQKMIAWLKQPQEGLTLILNPKATSGLNTLFKNTKNQPNIINLLVGPEGGFSAEEIKLAEEFSWQSIRLGPRILRTETAALVMASILQARWGDLGNDKF